MENISQVLEPVERACPPWKRHAHRNCKGMKAKAIYLACQVGVTDGHASRGHHVHGGAHTAIKHMNIGICWMWGHHVHGGAHAAIKHMNIGIRWMVELSCAWRSSRCNEAHEDWNMLDGGAIICIEELTMQSST
eukprot:533879-Pelagomonas_calceolata.AAC.3